MNYLILFFSILVNSTKSAYSNLFGKNHIDSTSGMMLFNGLCGVFSVAVLLAFSKGMHTPSVYTFCMSLLFGAVVLLLQISFFLSMATGSMAYTMLFTSSGMIIPSIVGTIVWKEEITPFQVVGLVILLVTFYLSANPKKDDKITFKWLKYALLCFLLSGGVGLLQKVFQSSTQNGQMNEFLICAFLFSTFFSFIAFFIMNKGEKITVFKKSNLSAIVIGICDALMHKINLYLAGALPSIIVFPLLNGGAIVVSTLLSAMVFKEKLSRKNILTVLICVIAILLISNIMKNFI